MKVSLSHQVGSRQYLQNLRGRHLTAHKQLDLILNTHLQAYIDQYGFLQLPKSEYQLAPTLHPYSYFYAYLRDLVIAAYPTSMGLRVDELGRKVHLFRYYLDRQIINYIRHYPAQHSYPTDLQRLNQYLDDFCLRADYQTDATFHNRSQGIITYPKNMKVQLIRNSYWPVRNRSRMVEFIINIDSGHFVSQWNVLRSKAGLVDSNPQNYSVAELQQVANTESFNYGIPYGQRIVLGKYIRTHQRLDIKQPADSQIRQRAKRLYPYPRKYVDLVKSPIDVVTWRKIPENCRAEVYRDYLQAGSSRWRPKRGINHFLAGRHTKFHRYYCSKFAYNVTNKL